jgi:hypothetical protein
LQDASVTKTFVEGNNQRQEIRSYKSNLWSRWRRKDFDDEYMYWIKDTRKVDYLAYSYHVNDGGVRFRAAFNPSN